MFCKFSISSSRIFDNLAAAASIGFSSDIEHRPKLSVAIKKPVEALFPHFSDCTNKLPKHRNVVKDYFPIMLFYS